MLILIYESNLPSPRIVVSPIKETHSCLIRKSSTAISPSTDAPHLSGSITERHANNSFPRNQFIHLWTHIGVEFTQHMRRTASTLGEDTLIILISALLYTFLHLSLFFLVSSFISVIYFLFQNESRRLCLTYFIISLCTSNNTDSIFSWIAPLHFIAWSWPSWSCFIACFRFCSLTVACCSALRFIAYLFWFGFGFTIFLYARTSIASMF